MEKTYRLNNFILWCKGWYIPVNPELSLFSQAMLALKLDDYCFVKNKSDVLNIVFNMFDEINSMRIKSGKNKFKFHVFYHQYNIYKMFDADNEEALLLALKYFILDLDKDDVKLKLPVYNKHLYKMGFKSPFHKLGTTYKQLNKQK